ncbi:MAG: hypothetical protein D6736_00805 [Nitrospinota bacterium]|nr:MAG: hypothetical protein D6736_00805 [Nitrospinota bacterium]
MATRGEENLQTTIATCKRLVSSLEAETVAEAKAWCDALSETITTLEGLQGKFFFKTNPSIPSTNACKKEVGQLENALQQKDWSAFAAGIDRFRQQVEALVKKAEMPGTILT